MSYLRVYNALHEIMIKTMGNHYQNVIIIVIKIKIHSRKWLSCRSPINPESQSPNPKSTFANIPFWVQGSRVRNIFVLKIWDSLRSEVNCSLEFQFAVIYEGCLPFTTAGNNYDVTTCNFGIKVTVEEVLIRCRRTFLSRHIDSWNNDDKRTRTTPCLPHTTALICWGDVKRLTRKLSWKRSAAANEQS